MTRENHTGVVIPSRKESAASLLGPDLRDFFPLASRTLVPIVVIFSAVLPFLIGTSPLAL